MGILADQCTLCNGWQRRVNVNGVGAVDGRIAVYWSCNDSLPLHRFSLQDNQIRVKISMALQQPVHELANKYLHAPLPYADTVPGTSKMPASPPHSKMEVLLPTFSIKVPAQPNHCYLDLAKSATAGYLPRQLQTCLHACHDDGVGVFACIRLCFDNTQSTLC